MHEDDRLLVLEGNIGEPGAVGRPRRRDDRLARDQRRLRILAVGVGDVQLVAAGALDHVGDLGREDAGFAGELFVDEVGDAVAGKAQRRRRGDVGSAAECGLAVDVVHAETRFEAAVTGTGNAAGGERVGALAAPVAPGRGRILVEAGGARIDQAEHAAAFEVAAHHRRQRARDAGLAGEVGDGDRDAVGAGAGDFDRQFGVRRCSHLRDEQRAGGKQAQATRQCRREVFEQGSQHGREPTKRSANYSPALPGDR